MEAGPMLSIETHEQITVLTFGIPPANRMTREFFEAFSREIDTIRTDPDIRALIIRGSGRHFSQGADIADLLSAFAPYPEGEIPPFFEENRKTFEKISHLKIPVIAALQGVCLGSALELSMFCHFRICARGALMSLPEASFNLMPGCGGTQVLQKLTRRNTALELMLGGRNVSPEDALQLGLVDAVCEKNDLIRICRNLASQINLNFDVCKKAYYLEKVLEKIPGAEIRIPGYNQ